MSGLLAVKIDITLVNPNHSKVRKIIISIRKKEKMSNPIVEQFSPPSVEQANCPTVEQNNDVCHDRAPLIRQIAQLWNRIMTCPTIGHR